MNSNVNVEALDVAVEDFEERWTPRLRGGLRDLLREHGLDESLEAATEFIRVDIARRYSEQCAVDLEHYFDEFPELCGDINWVPLIAFEDYRSRCRFGFQVDADRWSELPGVAEQPWYKESLRRKSHFGPSRSATGQELAGLSGTAGLAQRIRNGLRSEPSPADAEWEERLEESGFSIVRRIGVGAFSTVYLAVQRSLADRHVVLKVVDRPLAEPQQLARLQHTNIVPIYSFHQAASKSVLCMPYAGMVTLADVLTEASPGGSRDGESLIATVRQRLDQTVHVDVLESPVPDLSNDVELAVPAAEDHAAMRPLERLHALSHHELAVWIFVKLASALTHAHARGVLHSDLKPANILIRNDGEPALLDFNLSKRLHTDRASDDGRAGGTLPYMPPEYLQELMGQPIHRSTSADVYSLGMILFEFVTGRLPFPSPRSHAPLDLEMAIDGRRRGAAWQGDEVPFGLRCIISRCLAFDPADRYQSAEQLQRDLECEMQHRPLRHAAEPSIKNRFRKWTKRHPRLCSTGVLSVLAVLIVMVLGAFAWRVNESNRSFAAERLHNQFRTRSDRALASLMSTGVDATGAPLREAERCLAMYGVLSDRDWRQRHRLTYLDEQSRGLVIHRLTDLLLRSASAQLAMDTGSLEPDSTAERCLELLQQPPFVDAAPVTISRLTGRAGISDAGNPLPVPSDDRPVDAFAMSIHQINRNRGEVAIGLLSPGLLNVIDPFSYWLALGRAQMVSHQHEAAEISFSMAIEHLADCPLGHFYLGTCRMQQRRSDKQKLAEADFTEALRLDPKLMLAHVSRALAREALGDLQGGIEDLSTYLQVKEHSSQALLIRSRLHHKLGDPRLGEADLNEALKRDPSTVDDWVSRALARLPTDREGALNDLAVAAELEPTSIRVLQNKAHVLSEHFGRRDEAIECLSGVLNLAPASEKALLGRAVLYAREGNDDAALADLDEAKRRIPRLTPASVYQAACVYALLSGHAADQDALHDATQFRRSALSWLSQAIQRGYGGPLLRNDPDLQAVHEEPAFQSLVQTVRIGGKP